MIYQLLIQSQTVNQKNGKTSKYYSKTRKLNYYVPESLLNRLNRLLVDIKLKRLIVYKIIDKTWFSHEGLGEDSKQESNFLVSKNYKESIIGSKRYYKNYILLKGVIYSGTKYSKTAELCKKYRFIKELTSFLNINTQTLHIWSEKSILRKYKLGAHAICFKSSEVNVTLIKMESKT